MPKIVENLRALINKKFTGLIETPKNCKKGDLLITMGAGNVVNIGDNLLKD